MTRMLLLRLSPARTSLNFFFCMKVPKNLADRLRSTMEDRLADRATVCVHFSFDQVLWLITATPGQHPRYWSCLGCPPVTCSTDVPQWKLESVLQMLSIMWLGNEKKFVYIENVPSISLPPLSSREIVILEGRYQLDTVINVHVVVASSDCENIIGGINSVRIYMRTARKYTVRISTLRKRD